MSEYSGRSYNAPKDDWASLPTDSVQLQHGVGAGNSLEASEGVQLGFGDLWSENLQTFAFLDQVTTGNCHNPEQHVLATSGNQGAIEDQHGWYAGYDYEHELQLAALIQPPYETQMEQAGPQANQTQGMKGLIEDGVLNHPTQPPVAPYLEQSHQEPYQVPQVLPSNPPVVTEPETPVYRCEPCNETFATNNQRKSHTRRLHQSTMKTNYGLVLSRRSELNNRFFCCYHGCEEIKEDANALNSHLHPFRGDRVYMVKEEDFTHSNPSHALYWVWLSELKNKPNAVRIAKRFEAKCHEEGHRHKFVIKETSLPSDGFSMAERCFVLAVYDAEIGLDASEENGQFIVLDELRFFPLNIASQP